ncbi:MAG: Maf family protein, partial [Planctomycetota bacterium]
MLYLASTSPRRHSILESAGIPFTPIEPGEEPLASGTPMELARIRARAKGRGARVPEPGALILAVDTVVDLDGCELGKPEDRQDAERMLRALSGREHLVHSAICLRQASAD